MVKRWKEDFGEVEETRNNKDLSFCFMHKSGKFLALGKEKFRATLECTPLLLLFFSLVIIVVASCALIDVI